MLEGKPSRRFESFRLRMIIDIKNDKCLPEGRYVLWNPDKIERAKLSLPQSSSERAILIEYDKIGGLIVKDGEKLAPQTLWAIEIKKMADSVENLTDDEILEIIRKSENTNVPGSRYQKARNEFDIRHKKRVEDSLRQPKVSIGILNQGRNNKFIDNTFEGLDVGIQDEGENTLAVGNSFTEPEKSKKRFYARHPWWFAIITGVILLMIGYLIDLFVGLLQT